MSPQQPQYLDINGGLMGGGDKSEEEDEDDNDDRAFLVFLSLLLLVPLLFPSSSSWWPTVTYVIFLARANLAGTYCFIFFLLLLLILLLLLLLSPWLRWTIAVASSPSCSGVGVGAITGAFFLLPVAATLAAVATVVGGVKAILRWWLCYYLQERYTP